MTGFEIHGPPRPVRLTDSKTGAQTRVMGQAAIQLLEAAKPERVEGCATLRAHRRRLAVHWPDLPEVRMGRR